MAEVIAAISLGAAIIAFLDYGGKVYSSLKEYLDSSEEAPRTISDIANRLELLLVVVDDIKREEQSGNLDGRTQTALRNAVDGLAGQLKLLKEYVDKLAPNAQDTWFKRARKAMSTVRSEKDVIRIQQKLLTYESTLTLYFSCGPKRGTTINRGTVVTSLWFDVVMLPIKKFVGRKDSLSVIVQSFHRDLSDSGRMKITVLHGLGGQGKSQLALRYCQTVRSRQCVFWIDASSMPSAVRSFNRVLSLVTASNICLTNTGEVRDLAGRVFKTFRNSFVIVLDNLDHPGDFAAVVQMLPQDLFGDALVTSRIREARRLGTPLELEAMTLAEGTELLLLQAGCENNAENQSAARDIVNLLSGLPLAIDQAGSYIHSQGLPLRQFMTHFEDRKRDILKYTPNAWSYLRASGTSDQATQLSVFTTWDLSFEELRSLSSSHEACMHVLSLASFLESSSVSSAVFKVFFEKSGNNPPSWMGAFRQHESWDQYLFQDNIAQLYGISLIQSLDLSTANTKFSLHPLVREWLRLRLDESEKDFYAEESTLLLKTFVTEILADANVPPIEDIQETVAHIDRCCQMIRQSPKYQAAHPNHRVAPGGSVSPVLRTYLNAIPKFSELYWLADRLGSAEDMILDGLKRTQDEDTAIKLQHHLGICYYRQRRFGSAEKCLQQTLQSEQNDSPDLDEKALETMLYLGVVYLEQGRFDEAMRILPVVKEARSRLLGPQDKDTLQTIQMLAIAYQGCLDFQSAEALFRQALEGFEPTLGKSHLWTLSTTHSFANLYRGFGDFTEAEKLYRKALRGYEQAMGSDHSTTLMVVHHLGTLEHARKRYEAAETYLRRALVGRTLVHGATHATTLETEQCLGTVYLEQDRLDLAETTLRQNLENKLTVYSPSNNVILGTAIPLAKLCQRQGKSDDAKTMLMIAHEACSQEVSSLQGLELKRELADLLLADQQNELAEVLKCEVKHDARFQQPTGSIAAGSRLVQILASAACVVM